jgi:hypothetical protein
VFSALDARAPATASQAQLYEANGRIDDRNAWARALYGISGVALTAGAVVLLWPRLAGSEAPVNVGLAPRAEGGALVGWSGRF